MLLPYYGVPFCELVLTLTFFNPSYFRRIVCGYINVTIFCFLL